MPQSTPVIQAFLYIYPPFSHTYHFSIKLFDLTRTNSTTIKQSFISL